MIYSLFVTACILTVSSFFVNKRDLISPSFLFCAAFTFAIAWATAYSSKWDLQLHWNTYFVIAGGMAEFVVVSGLVQWWMGRIHGKRIIQKKRKLNYIYISPWIKAIIILFSLFIIVATVIGIIRIMSSNLANIMIAITQYRDMGLFEGKTVRALPSWINFGRTMITALGYWFLYVFINNMILKKRDILSLIIVVISAASTLTSGARGDVFFMIVSAVVIYVALKNKQMGFRKSIKIKTLIGILVIGLIVLFTFQWTATAIGRVADFKLADYIAIYCGAEIKNLDMFLQENHMSTHIWGGQTFYSLVHWLGPIFGIKTEGYSLDIPFRSVNGFNLGNVYTTFYPYIYDFGMWGVVVLVGLMALLVQWNYERVKRAPIREKPGLCMLMYEYMSASVVFSFFSNKFYEVQFSENFVRIIIIWLLCNWFFCSFMPKVGMKGKKL